MQPNPQGQETRTHIVGTAVTLGLFENVSLAANLPILFNRTIETGASLDETRSGIGDINLLVQYFGAGRLAAKPINYQLAAGVSLPTGNLHNAESEVQNLNSGTVDPVFRALGAWNFSPNFSLIGTFFTRRTVGRADDGFKAGSTWRAESGLTFAPVGGTYDLNVKMRFLKRDSDELPAMKMGASGGEFWDAALGGSKQLIGVGENAVRFWAELQLPIHQWVIGNQLTSSWTVRGGFIFNIPLLSHDDEPAEQPHGIPIPTE